MYQHVKSELENSFMTFDVKINFSNNTIYVCVYMCIYIYIYIKYRHSKCNYCGKTWFRDRC